MQNKARPKSFLDDCLGDYHKRLIYQDEISAHLEVQLAFISVDRCTEILEGLRSTYSEIEFDQMLVDIDNDKFYSKPRLEFWKNSFSGSKDTVDESLLLDFSGESPALQILRTSYLFRVLETAYIMLKIEQMRTHNEHKGQDIRIPGQGKASLTLVIAPCTTWDGYTLLGPAFISDALTLQRSFNQKELIQPFIDVFSIFLERHEVERIGRYSVLRSVISQTDSQCRIDSINGFLKLTQRVSIGDYQFSSSIIRSMLRLMLGTVMRPIGFNLKNDLDDNQEFFIPVLEGTHVSGTKHSGSSVILKLKKLRSNNPRGTIKFIRGEENEVLEEPRLNRHMSEVADRAHTNAIDQRLENLLVFRGWVFDYMGDAEPSTQSSRSSHRFERLQEFMLDTGTIVEAIACSWIWKMLRCDIVTFYRLDHQRHELKAQAYYTSENIYKKWARKNAEQINETNFTTDSNDLYRICQTGEIIVSTEGSEVGETSAVAENINPMGHLDSVGLETPNSFYMLPVKHGERIIGVIECVSFRPFSFDEFSVLLTDEFCDLLGKYFIAQANAELVSDVRQNTTPSKWMRDPAHRFDELAVAIAKYFLAHSATIWVVDSYDQSKLNHEGSINRSFPKVRSKSLRGSVRVDLEDKVSVTARAMKNGVWRKGIVGKGEFGNEWLAVEHRIDIVSEKANYIAIIPVRDQNNDPLASITLMSKHSEFLDDWRPQVDFCIRMMGTALSDSKLIERVLFEGLSETAHEVSNISNHLYNASKTITALSQSKTLDEDWLLSTRLHLDDIRIFSSDMRDIADILEPTSLLELYNNPHFRGSPMLKFITDKLELRQVNLKTIWNMQIENMKSLMRRRKLGYNVEWCEGDATLKLDQMCTGIAIRNVLGNAVKYAPVGSDVMAQLQHNRGKGNFTMRISNYGPELSKDELLRIFRRRFQGNEAKKKFSLGRGEGLYQTEVLMKAMGGRVFHLQDVTNKKGHDVYHTFSLKFRY